MIPSKRNGVALISALLIVAVATAASASLAFACELWLRQAQSGADRAQADALLNGALDWSAELLTVKAQGVDSLEEAWAQPVGPLELGGGSIRFEIADLQARFNVNNLVRNGAVNTADVDVFRRLLIAIHVDDGLAEQAAERILTRGELRSPAELAALPGFTQAALTRALPLLTALPAPTEINLNTAPREILAALFPTVGGEVLDRMAASRITHPLRDRSDAPDIPVPSSGGSLVGVSGSFFLVRAQASAGRVELACRALIKRPVNGDPAFVVWRSDEP